MASPAFVAALLPVRWPVALGAAIYALHCVELTVPFLAVWYVIGMMVPVLAGAVLGRWLLRW